MFSGLDPEHRTYDFDAWRYQGGDVGSAAGNRDRPSPKDNGDGNGSGNGRRQSVREAARGEAHGSGGAEAHPSPDRDETLQHPRCVFQVLKRHFSRYTPEMVEQICGISPDAFRQVCEALTSNSGRDRTTAFVYSVGWTHHTVGVQYIRAGAICRRCWATWAGRAAGSWPCAGTPRSRARPTSRPCSTCCPVTCPCRTCTATRTWTPTSRTRAWTTASGPTCARYMVSLLKAYWGEAATADNDYCFDYLPRLTGSHGTYETVQAMLAGDVSG